MFNCTRTLLASVLFIFMISNDVEAQDWCDDFESYAPGSNAGPNWHGSGNTPGITVDNTTAASGLQSLKMYGYVGGCWGAIAFRSLQLTYPFTIELKVMNGTESLSGCHPSHASMEFKMGTNWWDPGVTGGFVFKANGDFLPRVNGPEIPVPGFALNVWHTVRGEYSTPGDGFLHVSYWVNDQFIGEFTRTLPPGGFNPLYLGIAAQEGTAWFDDVCVTAGVGNEPLPVPLDIKPGKCPNVIKIEDDEEDDGFADYGYDGATAKLKHDDDDDDGKKIKVAVLGTADFDVNDINVASVQLAGVEPSQRWKIKDKSTPVDGTATCACTDEGKDGFDDLILKFRQSELLAAIGQVVDGDEIELTLTGELTDGTPFEGSDCVVIRIEDDDDGDGSKSSLAESNNLPTSFALDQNYPNPFNPETQIGFSLPRSSFVTLDVFNVEGRRVRRLVNERLSAGSKVVTWDSRDDNGLQVSSGIYLYRITAGDFTESRKMILLK